MNEPPRDGPDPPEGDPVKAATQQYANGEVLILRTKGSLTEWVISNAHIGQKEAR